MGLYLTILHIVPKHLALKELKELKEGRLTLPSQRRRMAAGVGWFMAAGAIADACSQENQEAGLAPEPEQV